MPQNNTPTPVEVVTETYEEKRAEALEDMGLELEDIRNFERWRLRVLERLNGGGSGGGSSVQTVTGTLASPWGDIDPTELGIAINNNEKVATMTISAMGHTVNTVLVWDNGLISNGGYVLDASNMLSISAWFSPVNGAFETCKYYENGDYMDVTSYAPSITTTLTVVTLPSSNNGGNNAD